MTNRYANYPAIDRDAYPNLDYILTDDDPTQPARLADTDLLACDAHIALIESACIALYRLNLPYAELHSMISSIADNAIDIAFDHTFDDEHYPDTFPPMPDNPADDD
jgi:hypothetical protein